MTRMKKFIAVLLIVVMSLSLVGCGNDRPVGYDANGHPIYDTSNDGMFTGLLLGAGMGWLMGRNNNAVYYDSRSGNYYNDYRSYKNNRPSTTPPAVRQTPITNSKPSVSTPTNNFNSSKPSLPSSSYQPKSSGSVNKSATSLPKSSYTPKSSPSSRPSSPSRR